MLAMCDNCGKFPEQKGRSKMVVSCSLRIHPCVRRVVRFCGRLHTRIYWFIFILPNVHALIKKIVLNFSPPLRPADRFGPKNTKTERDMFQLNFRACSCSFLICIFVPKHSLQGNTLYLESRPNTSPLSATALPLNTMYTPSPSNVSEVLF